ncbi:unnamed protein product [Blepharisma stoltei]|uniref:STOP protein n=1 Tax=Blepharisma stoltei TaxID=1481888 RepID=A0AAU9J4V1_9CILI|nr:unnamed protein product [Blepharisma stoltei]
MKANGNLKLFVKPQTSSALSRPHSVKIKKKYARPQSVDFAKKKAAVLKSLSVNSSFANFETVNNCKGSSNNSKRNSNRNETGCALDDPKLPPVNEMEHTVGQCYCYLCTCGKHKCPGEYKPNTKFAMAQFSTNYKIEYYKKKRFPIVNLVSNPSYSPNKFPFENITIKRQDYKPHQIEPQKKLEKEGSKDQKLKFAGRSTYDADYLNWGPAFIEKSYQQSLPYRPKEVKMNIKSSYIEEFSKKLPLENKEANAFSKSLALNNWKSSDVFPPNSIFIGESSTKKDFGSYKIDKRPTKEKGKMDEVVPKQSWMGQYSTTYNDSFTGESDVHIPKKKELLGRKSQNSFYL